MHRAFEVARGSILGREHTRTGKNNQDSSALITAPDYIVGVVTDGCGSGERSEVGAHLGAHMAAEILRDQIEAHFLDLPDYASEDRLFPRILSGMREEILICIHALAKEMGGDLQEILYRHFLFTIVGAVITPELTAIFTLGDGVYAINGIVSSLDQFPDNAPPYLAYDILKKEETRFSSDALQFAVRISIPTYKVQSLLLGSDGVTDLIRAEPLSVPGKEESVGPLSQFWEEDRYFENQDAVRRKLALLNREVTRIHWEEKRVEKIPGLLPDDTTLIAIRRRKPEGG